MSHNGNRGLKKEQKKALRAAQESGWKVKAIKHGFMLYPPDKKLDPITIHSSETQNGYAAKNSQQLLRRAGLDI